MRFTASKSKDRRGAVPAKPPASRPLQGYERLRDYFPVVSQRAAALGVTRDTIMAWDRRAMSRVRRENERRLRQLLRLCEAVDQYLPTRQLTGRWLRSPQTFLYGETPIEYLAEGGEVDWLIGNLQRPAQPVPPELLEAHNQSLDDLDELVAPEYRVATQR
jgi:hypothetical protein